MTKREARQLGREHGRNAGSWVLDGNSTQETARAILKGYDDGDDQIMDLQPSPLSGEWAGDPTPQDFNFSDSLMDEYEAAFGEAFWKEVLRSARAIA